jgi:hypothetical protein
MASSGATHRGAAVGRREQPWEQSRSRDKKRCKEFVAALGDAVGAQQSEGEAALQSAHKTNTKGGAPDRLWGLWGGQCRDGGPHRQAEQYLLDNVLAAEGISNSILREEIGAACFNAHAHILLGCTKFCQPGYGAAYGRRRDQDGRSNPR